MSVWLRFALVFLGMILFPGASFASGGHDGGSQLVVHHLDQVQNGATICFALAIFHTLVLTSWFNKLAHHYKEGTVMENLFHFLGEAEVVFGLWAAIFFLFVMKVEGVSVAVAYLEGRIDGKSINFTEPAFVFVIMAIASTRPILELSEWMIEKASGFLPFSPSRSFYLSALVIGPLLGSFITEPAAMTVTALLLLKRYFSRGISDQLKYATLAILFVNVSIGGTLTHFAAPPVLMVATKWQWGMSHMIGHFGYKAAVAVILNAFLISTMFGFELNALEQGVGESTSPAPKNQLPRRERRKLEKQRRKEEKADELLPVAWWVTGVHLFFLGVTVVFNHHMVMFMGAFLFFLGFLQVTQEYQKAPDLKGPILVGFFLAGLVTLGGFQAWWLQPLLARLGEVPLFLGATGLTAVTDNAALTYLGSLVEGLPDTAKYALVAGAVAGGGLTIIANAPNPAGNAILGKSFEDGVSAGKLFAAAFGPTLIAMVCLWFLPNL